MKSATTHRNRIRNVAATVMRILALMIAVSGAAAAQQYDLLLKGGHVIDPANNINEPRDVAVAEGKIAAVARNIAAGSARKVVDVTGFYVTPGMIDIHAHVPLGRAVVRWSHPADMNFSSGLTTVVDAGSHGARDIHLLRENVVAHSRIRVLAFLNIVGSGMGDKEQDIREMDAQLCADTICKNRDILIGVKTAHYWTGQPWDKEHPPWQAVEKAVEAGTIADAPVMVDLVSKFLFKARERGIYFDLGHGAGSFWWRNAVPAIKQGFVPDSISTDLHMGNVNGPVVDFITTASKLLVMGVPLEDVIRRATVNPARQIRRPELGTLTVGREADIAVLELRKGKFGYTDCGRAKFIGEGKLENRLTVRAGQIVYDPSGISMVEWVKAPKQYFTTPRLQGVDPTATAEPPDESRRRRPNR